MTKLQRGSWRKDRKRGNRNIVGTVLLGKGSEQVYVQNGKYFAPNGVELDTPPDWAAEEVLAMSKGALEKLGFEVKFGKVKAKKPPEPEPEPEVVEENN